MAACRRFLRRKSGNGSAENLVTKLEYHPDAADELAEAYEWYDAIDRVVGERFKRELERAEELVGRSPAAWGRYFHDTQGFRFRSFPVVMVYVVREEQIIVIAIAHTRRRPGYWRERLAE